MDTYRFVRRSRSNTAILVLAAIYTALIAAIVLIGAAWWLMAWLALFTLPALWDLYTDSSAEFVIDSQSLRWRSGKREGSVPLNEIEYIRLDTRWDFSIRATLFLTSGKKVRLPQESLPPHKVLETQLNNRDLRVERHHFRVF